MKLMGHTGNVGGHMRDVHGDALRVQEHAEGLVSPTVPRSQDFQEESIPI